MTSLGRLRIGLFCNVMPQASHHSVTCRLCVLFGSFGRSGSSPDGTVIISYYRNFSSVDWIARPFGTTENQISHSWIRGSCRSMDSG